MFVFHIRMHIEKYHICEAIRNMWYILIYFRRGQFWENGQVMSSSAMSLLEPTNLSIVKFSLLENFDAKQMLKLLNDF